MSIKGIYHVYVIIWLLLTIFISIGSYNGIIYFGHGLADILYIGATTFIAAGVLVFYIIDAVINKGSKSIKDYHIAVVIISFIFLIYIILKTTYLRGAEYEWDGVVFPGWH